MERNGEIDSDDLLNRLVWGAHAHRQFPAIEGPTVLPEPPSSQEDDENKSSDMAVDGPVVKAPLRRIFPGHRLYQAQRGPRLASDIRFTTPYNAVHAMRLGATEMPYHLQYPIHNYTKLHQHARRRGHMMELFSIMYDRTGHRIFTGSQDWLIKIWSARTGLLVQTLRGHKAPIITFCIDPTNRYLASASEDNTIRVWSLATYTNVAVLQNAHTKPIEDLSWSSAPQINALVSVAQDGVVKVWELRPLPAGKQGDVETLMGRDTTLRFRDSTLECNNSPCQSGPISPCGTRALVSCKDGSVRILALNPLRQLQRIVAHNSNVPCTAWSHSTSRFLSASDDGTAKVFEYLNSEKGWVLLFTLSVLEIHAPGPKPKMREARWSLNDDYIILVYQPTAQQQNRQIKVFCARTGRLLGSLDGHDRDVHAIEIHPLDHRIIVSAGYDQKIIFWNLETLRPVAQYFMPNFEDEECPLTSLAFSPDGSQLVFTDLIGTFSIFGFGPADSFKGPIEQFFSTDYQETTMDLNGYVVDTETQIPPHLTPRTLLCYRGGRSHEIQYVLPPLRDPTTEIPLEELQSDALQRAEAAATEDASFNVGEVYIAGQVVVPQIGLGVGLPGQLDVAPVAARTRGGAAPGSPARAQSAVGRNGTPAALSRAGTTVIPANNGPSAGFSRLRRNNTSNGPAAPAAAPSAAPSASNGASGERRPPRRAASRGVSALLEMNQDIDEASRQAILDMEDELEEDFSDVEAFDDDESISAGEDAERDNFDLYWSGDEATAGFRSPMERRNRGNNETTARVSTRSSSNLRSGSAPRRITESEEDSDEDYANGGGPPRSRPPRPRPAAPTTYAHSSSPAPTAVDANGSPIPKRSRGRPPKSSTLLQRAITAAQQAIAAGQQPAINLSGLSYDQQQQYHKAVSKDDQEDEDDEDLDIMSDSESDVAIESDYEEEKPKRKSHAKKEMNKPKPASYPSWVTQTSPSSIYCPQLGDEVVFAQPGYLEYINTQKKYFPHLSNAIPPTLPMLSYCRISNISYQANPFVHAIVELSTIMPMPAIPPVLYSEQTPPPPALPAGVEGDEAKKKGLKVKLSRRPTPPPRPFVSMQTTAFALAQQYPQHQMQMEPLKFTVHYHGGAAQVPDFLILASRFNQGMSQEWHPGKYVSAWIADEQDVLSGDYYPGTVLEANVKSPWEALTIIWEDGDAMRMSPWEVDVVDPTAIALMSLSDKIPNGPRLPIFAESLDPEAANHLAQSFERYMQANSDTVGIFMDPVPLDDYPSYLPTNPWPVHLTLLLNRLRGGWYRTLEALRRDIECIHANSVAFNGETTAISINARQIADSLHQILNTFKLNVMLITKRYDRDGDEEGSNNQKKRKRDSPVDDDEDLDVESYTPAKHAHGPTENSASHQSNERMRRSDSTTEQGFELSHLAAAASHELSGAIPTRNTAANGNGSSNGMRVSLRSANAAHPPAPAPVAESTSGRPVRASRTRTSFKEPEWDEDDEDDAYPEPSRRRR